MSKFLKLVTGDYQPVAVEGFDEDNVQFRCCCGKCHVRRGAFVIGLIELVFVLINLIDAIRHMATSGSPIASSTEVLMALGFMAAVVLMIWGVRKEKKNFLIPHLVWSVIFCIFGLIVAIIILASWYFAGSALAFALASADNAAQKLDKLSQPSTTPVPHNLTRALVPVELPPEGSGEYKDDDFGSGAMDTGNENDSKFYLQGGLWVVAIMLVGTFLIVVALEIWFFIVIRSCYKYLKAKEEHLRSMKAEGVPLVRVEA